VSTVQVALFVAELLPLSPDLQLIVEPPEVEAVQTASKVVPPHFRDAVHEMSARAKLALVSNTPANRDFILTDCIGYPQ